MDPVQCCILFDNEFHEECFRQPRPDESVLDYTTRLNWIAAQWYHRHLGGKVKIIFLTDNMEVANEVAKRDPHNHGVLMMDLASYLQTYHSKLTTVLHLFDSLNASLKVPKIGLDESTTLSANASNLPQQPSPGDVYPAHLSESALLAGIRSGQFLQGVLRVSRFRCATEAIVVLTE